MIFWEVQKVMSPPRARDKDEDPTLLTSQQFQFLVSQTSDWEEGPIQMNSMPDNI